ncbi:MAG: aldehyde ferredoxin oxidoreductase family protein [Candidatus Bathyarchaeia archaeon]|nr:aldehyde ferredoxin oxidoreductase family protein [Candidatus Bathyarchaeota archaeon]
MIQGGFTGYFLDVNLNSGDIKKKSIEGRLIRKFIGGTGLATKLLYDEVGPDIDPFDERNILIITAGPLIATGAPMACRTDLITKSPLTGLIGCSNVGGFWATHLKKAGYDMIILRGESKNPVYLWINEDSVEIRDAGHLWAKRDTLETTDELKKELSKEVDDEEISVMAIGPAGENLVRYACIMVDKYHAAGRTGCGAVLGKKKVKAIAVHGKKKVQVAKPKEFKDAVNEALKRIVSDPSYKTWSNYASLPVSEGAFRKGVLPGRNWQTTVIENWLKTRTLEAIVPYVTPRGQVDLRKIGCANCPVQCFHQVEVREGKFKGLKISSGTFIMPVFEFGAKCEINDLPAIWKCKELCHRFGLDIASAACAVAFAMELYERGLITERDAGLQLKWGDAEAVFEMLRKIAFKEQIGGLLAEGIIKAAEKIGGDSKKAAIAVKKMELMGNDPRVGAVAWNMGILVNPRGGDNVRTTHFGIEGKFFCKEIEDKKLVEWLDMPKKVKMEIFGDPPVINDSLYKGKALMTKWYSLLTTIMNALGMCIFASMSLDALGPSHYAKLYTTATGIDMSAEELMKAGERIFTLQRMYNIRMGATREDDAWPSRFYEPLPDGPSKGKTIDRNLLEKTLEEFYKLMGWQKNGTPAKEKIKELELEEEYALLQQ